MQTQNLSEMKVADLITLHNDLAAKAGDHLPLKSWKQGKAKLVPIIESLQAKVGDDDQDVGEGGQNDGPVLTGETIRETALELLCHVAYHEDRREKPSAENRVGAKSKNARSVGLPYDEVIRRIQGRFPDCQTTVACLRWYAVKVRAEEEGYEGLRLPQRRPRVKPRNR